MSTVRKGAETTKKRERDGSELDTPESTKRPKTQEYQTPTTTPQVHVPYPIQVRLIQSHIALIQVRNSCLF